MSSDRDLRIAAALGKAANEKTERQVAKHAAKARKALGEQNKKSKKK